MNEKTFEERLARLTARQLEVLRLFLAGDPDPTIAQTCKIAQGTVRKHIEKTCKTLRLTPAPGERSKRPELIQLFQTYRPEWVQQSLVSDPEESIEQIENQESEDISWLTDQTLSLIPQPLLPSLGEGEQDLQSPSPKLGEGFRERASNFCQSTRDISFISSCVNPNFVGREDDLAELDRRVKAGYKEIEIVATGGIGKSCFAQEYLKQFDRDRVLEFNMARESQGVVSPLGRMEEWLKELGEEPGREFDISKERLRKKLREASSKIAIFIDNLEPTLENGLFIQPYRSEYVELLRVLTDSQVNSVTLITSREPLHESDISVETYRLKGLDLKAWQQYFQGQKVDTNSPSLKEMRDAYDGNAKAMEILCSAIQKDADSNLDAYWQKVRQDLLQHKTLEHLVATQFDRLEQTNRNAYNLLCRLGCYRYQDVPLVPKEGVLCLLWDVPENRRLRILDALRDRGLVDVSKQQYLLHPVIREVVIERLRQNKEDWEKANRQAAEFWTASVETVVTQEDAIQALEAYYHYVEIEDFNLAGIVIINLL